MNKLLMDTAKGLVCYRSQQALPLHPAAMQNPEHHQGQASAACHPQQRDH